MILSLALGLYLFIGFVIGYTAAREVYRKGTTDGIVRPGSTGYAFFSWAVFTATWPIFLLLTLLVLLFDSANWQALGKRLFG